MIARTNLFYPIVHCLTGLLILQTVTALGTDETLLNVAREEITTKAETFWIQDQTGTLSVKLAILESQSNLEVALDRARSIEDPFYASLALGGIAVVEIPSDPNTSMILFREALEHSISITRWNDDHATSLELLFELIPSYPKEEAYELLSISEETLTAWNESASAKGKSLLTLAKVTTTIAPEKAKPLLLDVALTSNHYWEAIEYLGTFMARQSPEPTLELAEQLYEAKKNWPNEQYFLRSVLIERARTDFPRAFEGIKKMRRLDCEIAAIKLAESLLAAKRKKDAKEVISYVQSLQSDFNWTQQSLERLLDRLKHDKKDRTPLDMVTPERIDDFLKAPNTTVWRALPWIKQITFQDEKQVREFIAAMIPLAESTKPTELRHYESQYSMVFGLLTVCSAMIGDTDRALELSNRIDNPALRAGYLLDAYEQTHPMPSVVSKWSIRFWRPIDISIQDRTPP